MEVSVLMSVHNGSAYLQNAMDSVLSQTFRDFEFLVIDDASTDDTPSIIKSYVDPRIRPIYNKANCGLTVSLNIGLGQAAGKWIVRLDSDDIMMPTRLQTQLQFVHQNKCSVCFTNAIVRDVAKGTSTYWRQTSWPMVAWAGLFFNSYGLHSAVTFRKSTILGMQGYDETFPFAQDYDLFDRLNAAGEEFGYVDEPLITLNRHNDQISFRKLEEQDRCARRISFRAIRRCQPGLTDEESLALRWLFLPREHPPASVPVNLVDLAGHLVFRFLEVRSCAGFARPVYKSLVYALAHRYRALCSHGFRVPALKLAFKASLRTRNCLLPLQWFRWTCRSVK